MPVENLQISMMLAKEEAAMIANLDFGPEGVPVDPADWLPGETIYAVMGGYLWKRDPDDHVSVPSSNCFVTASTMEVAAVRFKKTPIYGQQKEVRRVKSFVDEAPEEPTTGDEYGINNSPTGEDFADHAGEIATCEYGGPNPIWSFTPKERIALAFDEQRELWRSIDVDGNWMDGLGSAYGVNSVPPEALKVSRYAVQSIIMVYPESPIVGGYYLVSASASGDLSTKQNKVLKCIVADEEGDEYEEFSPKIGDTCFVLSVVRDYNWTGASWETAIRAVVVKWPARVSFTFTGALAAVASPSYASAMTNSQGTQVLAFDYAPLKATNRLRFEVRTRLSAQDTAEQIVGIFAEGELTAFDQAIFNIGLKFSLAVFYYEPGTVVSKNYKIRQANGTVFSGYVQVIEVETA